MITKQNILDLVKQYVETNDLNTFAHSFAPLFYDIEHTGDADAVQFAYQIEAMFAAMTAGVCSEAAFQSAMKAFSPSISVIPVIPEQSEHQSIVFLNVFTKLAVAAGTVKLVIVGTAPSVGFGSATELPNTHQTNTSPSHWQQVLTGS
jgi:hypothetical protein